MRNWITASTIADMFDRQAAMTPDKDALCYPDACYSFAELTEAAERFARGLLALGVRPGDRVGYFLNESVDTGIILYAAAKLGAVLVPVNARFKMMELRHVIEHAGIKVLFTTRVTDADYAETLMQRLPELKSATDPASLHLKDVPKLGCVVYLGEGEPPGGMLVRKAFLAMSDTVDNKTVEAMQETVRVRDLAIIVYTSGTTAAPKGAMLSHESFSRMTQALFADRFGIDEESRVWTALPMFHVGALTMFISTLGLGATLYHPGHFDPQVSLRQLRDARCTHALPGFDLFWRQIVCSPDFQKGDLPALRLLLLVGVEESVRALQEITPQASIVQNTGMTEACGYIAVSSPDDPLDSRMTSCGRPFAGVQCEIRDPENSELLPWGARGELWFRSPMQFDGYFRAPDANAEVFDERGFFRTGDVVQSFEDGRIIFVSRIKDMLKVGGENVAAAEVEGYLSTHPAVRVAQVVAAPDEKYGEVPAAYLELNPGSTAGEDEIIEFCRGKVASFRLPKYVRFIDEWPMSGTKIKKHELRKRIADELA